MVCEVGVPSVSSSQQEDKAEAGPDEDEDFGDAALGRGLSSVRRVAPPRRPAKVVLAGRQKLNNWLWNFPVMPFANSHKIPVVCLIDDEISGSWVIWFWSQSHDTYLANVGVN